MFNKEHLSLLLRLYNGPVDENALKIQITQINSSFILYLNKAKLLPSNKNISPKAKL